MFDKPISVISPSVPENRMTNENEMSNLTYRMKYEDEIPKEIKQIGKN